MVNPGPGSQSTTRLSSVDELRGLVMIVMALDHTRDFFHSGAMSFSPEDLTRTTAALFFTRWITHFCAPVFMFTAGLGAFFWLARGGRTKSQLSRFLWTRGLWLVALALLLHLPVRVLAPLSIAVIALHNLADGVQASQFGSAAWVWNILHQQ